MATKQSIIAGLTKSSYSAKEVLQLVNSIVVDPIRPPYIQKGDCFSERLGMKKRPCCVIKVVGNLAYAIPLTSTDNEMTLCEGKVPRFAANCGKDKSYFSKSIIAVPVNIVQDNYLFSYENNATINKAIRQMRELVYKVLG